MITHPTTSPTYRKAGLKIPPDSAERYGFFRPSEEVRQAWEETRRFAQALQARVIVFQCPPSFGETPENMDNMRRFFRIAKDTGFLLVWEPRGDWHETTIKSLCLELGLVHCVDPLERESLYGQPQY